MDWIGSKWLLFIYKSKKCPACHTSYEGICRSSETARSVRLGCVGPAMRAICPMTCAHSACSQHRVPFQNCGRFPGRSSRISLWGRRGERPRLALQGGDRDGGVTAGEGSSPFGEAAWLSCEREAHLCCPWSWREGRSPQS